VKRPSLTVVRPEAGTELDVERAAALLAQARSVDEVREIREKARAIEVYQRMRGASLSAQQDAAEIVLRAERRLGELCAVVAEKSQTAGLKRGPRPDSPSGREKLGDLGIAHHESSRWQKLAAIPEPVFEQHVAAVRMKGERLTTAGTIAATSSIEGYDSDEWYTPAKYVEAAREVLGEIDLDPASCEHAQRRIRARRFYTKRDDGLAQRWKGRVWLNPPYSQPLATQFADKLLEEHAIGRVTAAIMVQNSGTDTGWFHRVASRASICLVEGRINFDRESGGSARNRYAQVFFYLGDEDGHERFVERFAEHGLVGRLRGRYA
jgi:phage N-6-adenine-methyltransferase